MVEGIHQEGRGGDWQIPWESSGKGFRMGRYLTDVCLPGNHDHEVVVRDVCPVNVAHISLSKSRLKERVSLIFSINGFSIKICDKAPALVTGRGGQGDHVPMARQVGGIFWLEVDVNSVRKDRQSRDVARGKR